MSPITSPKKARYLELAQYFSQQIREGQLRPGERLPSFTQMREQFGVTPATVERLYSLLEREKLIERRHRSGVYVAETTSNLAVQGTLGFVAQGFSEPDLHPYNFHLLRGVHRVAEKAGVQVMILNWASLAASRNKVDGLLVYRTNLPGTQQPPICLERDIFGLPCVSMLISQPAAGSVVADEVSGGRLAVQHLLDLGHRRIACMIGSFPEEGIDILGERRLRGYRNALREADIEPDERWVRSLRYNRYGSYAELGMRQMGDWIREDWGELGCTAILAQNDETAFGIIRGLQEHGLRVPEDVSVIGYDGIVASSPFGPSLTTVEVPLERISSEATAMLLRKIGGDVQEEHLVVPVSLRVGETSAVVAELDYEVVA